MKIKIKNLYSKPIGLKQGNSINPGEVKIVELDEDIKYRITNKILENLGNIEEKNIANSPSLKEIKRPGKKFKLNQKEEDKYDDKSRSN